MFLLETVCSIWRSVTGTRVQRGTVCFSLFALVSMPDEVMQLHTEMGMQTFLLFEVAAVTPLWTLVLIFKISSRRGLGGGEVVVVVNSCSGCLAFITRKKSITVGRRIPSYCGLFICCLERGAWMILKRLAYILFNVWSLMTWIGNMCGGDFLGKLYLPEGWLLKCWMFMMKA